MRKRRVLALSSAAALIWLAGSAAAQQAEAPTPAPKEPVRVETPAAVVPIAVTLEDFEQLQQQLEELRLRQRGTPAAVAATVDAPADDTKDDTPDRTIEIEPSEVINLHPTFRFLDATDRDGGPTRVPGLTLEQRRAAAEAYRQALAKNKKNGRQGRR